MINSKIIEMINDYGLVASTTSNLVFVGPYLVIDFSSSNKNNNLKGTFNFTFKNFCFHGNIDFSNNQVIVSDLISKPISISDLMDAEGYEIASKKIFNFLGITKAELKFI